MYESGYVTASGGKTNITDADKPRIRVKCVPDNEFEECNKVDVGRVRNAAQRMTGT